MRLAVAVLALWVVSNSAFSKSTGAPAVKKSEQGICHERGSATYKRTKHFESYDTLEACLASGGRVAKNAAADRDDEQSSGSGSSWLGTIGKKVAVIVGMLVIVGGAFLLSRRRAPPQ